MIVDQDTYRAAFLQYLRKGTPISVRSLQTFEYKKINIDSAHYHLNPSNTTHYIWRTRRDGKVRSSHAERDGEIFSWNNPPTGGHPGEDHNCRCTAVPLANDDPRLNVPSTLAVPYCEQLLEQMESTQHELAGILDDIAEFGTAERARVEALPGAAEAYGGLIFDLAVLAATFTGTGVALRVIRRTTQASSLVDKLKDAADALDFVRILSGADRFMETWQTAKDVWGSSELRSLLEDAKRGERKLRGLFDQWEAGFCSLHVDR